MIRVDLKRGGWHYVDMEPAVALQEAIDAENDGRWCEFGSLFVKPDNIASIAVPTEAVPVPIDLG